MKTVNDIRSEFLGFFGDKGHEIVPSSPLVPQNDPSLMFTNSGMVQFKNVFTGAEKRPYRRAVTAQKCVRAGGKHNDLENVGYTARHHTFFEMLGNFSFGDYFKEEAIAYAWELITKNFAMPKEKLLITVHSTDEEAAGLWRKIAGFTDDKIIRIPTDDNFWRMGDTGPCGPSSEIFYDQGEALQGGPPGSPDEDGDRFLEFWNLVFMQYEQIDAETLNPLPRPSIDTGMGLERMTALVQGLYSNYDVDILRDIILHVADITGVDPDGKQAASHRVIADHLRAGAFLIADGVLPSNEGRGYVLRRIMRRGMRHAHLLGAEEPLLHRLFPTLHSKMSKAYPELDRARALITETLRGEEERFKRTLDTGIKLLEEETGKVRGGVLPGEVAFKLYDTFGFPLDLTQDALKEKGIAVDTAGFEKAMKAQKERARAAWSGSGGKAIYEGWYQLLDDYGPTEFVGYASETATAQVLAILQGTPESEGAALQKVNEARQGEGAFIVTNQTPFYGESGGQVGDTGTIKSSEGTFVVNDTKKMFEKLWLHIGKVLEGKIAVNDTVEMKVDPERRAAIRANHSATHLMHEALRRVLGAHVSQKGALQDAERTRFDISHPKGITPPELEKIEALVNAEIAAASPVETRIMPLEEARESGAMALFGEKYDDEVRVVCMGSKEGNRQFSVELCGGTHVKNTGEIGAFKIISESALSSGVRRLEAMTGLRAEEYERGKKREQKEKQEKLEADNEKLRAELQELGGAPAGEMPGDIAALEKENKRLQKEIADLRRRAATESAAGADADIREIGGVKFSGQVLEGVPPQDLKPMADALKKKLGSGVVALVAVNDGRASLVVGVTDDLTARINAVDLVRIGAEALGGKGGGGRPDLAQAGGPDAGAADKAVGAIEKALAAN